MNEPEEIESVSPFKLIQQIKSGQFSPKLLRKEDRQMCVLMFITDGYSYVHIAEILKCSTKTIQRDFKDICRKNSILVDKDFIHQCLGRLKIAAEANCTFLMRLARDKNASVMERVQAEFMAFKVVSEAFNRYKSVGLFDQIMTFNKQINKSDGVVKNMENNISKNEQCNELASEEQLKRLQDNIRILKKYGVLDEKGELILDREIVEWYV